MREGQRRMLSERCTSMSCHLVTQMLSSGQTYSKILLVKSYLDEVSVDDAEVTVRKTS